MNVQFLLQEHHESFVDLLCNMESHYHGPAASPREVVHAHAMQHLLAPGSPLSILVAGTRAKLSL